MPSDQPVTHGAHSPTMSDGSGETTSSGANEAENRAEQRLKQLNLMDGISINGTTIAGSDIGEDEYLKDNFAVKPARRLDDYDVDFSDTRKFAFDRWVDLSNACTSKLSLADREIAAKYINWESVTAEIQQRMSDPATTYLMKKQMGRIQVLPQVLSLLTRKFRKMVSPMTVGFDILWGMMYLNLKMSYTSSEALKRTTTLLNKIKRIAELFVKCLDACEQENEARIAVVDFMDPLTSIFLDSIEYFHACSTDQEVEEEAWPDLEESINSQLSLLDEIVKHLSDITSFAQVNLDRKYRYLQTKHSLMPESDEPGTFPNRVLPNRRNRFYGRKAELDKIYEYLRPKKDGSLRTYTIYGKRGVGKTEIALQFAYNNPIDFNAVFWIRCETSVAIRQSFTDVAVSLNLPKANRDGHHEENLLAVHDWLKRTKKTWLLIFDNAESERILKGYWPLGASGAILITSRSYTNFQKDAVRKGNTIKPFNDKQSWELLLQLLGEEWKQDDRAGKIPPTEIVAAKTMLEILGGLALAIQQAAVVIKEPEIGGPTIARTLELLREKIRTLPERHASPRTPSDQALDALWDMIFNELSPDARTILGVFAWLNPDSIPVELFLPRNQSALDGPLAFCKQESKNIDHENKASFFSLTSPSPLFDKAIGELVQRELVRKDGKEYSIHRVVQEATSFHNLKTLQDSFDSACKIVYEAFPKVRMNGSLYSEWSTCQVYIAHGVYLSKRFAEHTRFGKLRGSDAFVRLLANCAHYLLEIGDYWVCAPVLDTAISACDNKRSLIYGELRNVAGNMYYELNRLKPCKEAWQETLKVRIKLLEPTNRGIAAIYNNLGNLELASGNVDEADTYFQKAIPIWIAGGDSTAENLALTYLCVGRLEMFRGQLDKALNTTTLSETMFSRTAGMDKGFIAYVHYLSGNIQYRQKHYEPALRSYNECLKIGLLTMPIHPIVVAAEYSLACVEFAMGHADNARKYLDKARTIADLRSPNRDDGNIARILWKTAQVLESDTHGRYADEAVALRTRAELARAELAALGEGGEMPEEETSFRDAEEDSYRVLVPLFFR